MICTFDGGCRLHECGAGAAVLFTDDGAEIARRATYMEGSTITTNIAEFCGLVNAIQLGLDHGATDLEILGDSEIIVRQFNGDYECRAWHLRVWRDHARSLATGIPRLTVKVFPRGGPRNKRRHANHVADALATECMSARRDLP